MAKKIIVTVIALCLLFFVFRMVIGKRQVVSALPKPSDAFCLVRPFEALHCETNIVDRPWKAFEPQDNLMCDTNHIPRQITLSLPLALTEGAGLVSVRDLVSNLVAMANRMLDAKNYVIRDQGGVMTLYNRDEKSNGIVCVTMGVSVRHPCFGMAYYKFLDDRLLVKSLTDRYTLSLAGDGCASLIKNQAGTFSCAMVDGSFDTPPFKLLVTYKSGKQLHCIRFDQDGKKVSEHDEPFL